MNVEKQTTYVIELTPAEAATLRYELDKVYPLFASEEDAKDIQQLLELKHELALAEAN